MLDWFFLTNMGFITIIFLTKKVTLFQRTKTSFRVPLESCS